jgi:hypothetical protein
MLWVIPIARNVVDNGQWPRLWWIPTGLLSKCETLGLGAIYLFRGIIVFLRPLSAVISRSLNSILKSLERHW